MVLGLILILMARNNRITVIRCPMWLVLQARVKPLAWFDAVLVGIYGCGRQLLAVAESIDDAFWAAAICL